MGGKMNPKSNGHSNPVNLKLNPDVKERFKEITHINHTTMQNVLYAFVDAYINQPEKFKIKMEIQ